MSEETNRLSDLLDYVCHVGKLNQKPVFKISEYKQLAIWEHELKGRIGVQHNIIDSDGLAVWLRVERLKRIAPPLVPDQIQEWLTVSNDPESYPQIKDKIMQTVTEGEVNSLIKTGYIDENDISDSLKNQGSEISLKDVIFRLDNNPKTKRELDNYISEQWLLWSEEEKPRRQTIKLYDSLFSFQQTIEALGDEQPVELVWGIGIARWLCEGHEIDHPLLEKVVEIEIDSNDGAISIHPRNLEPAIVVGAYFALENAGVDTLLRFSKKHFSELSEDVDFSPYAHESFEPILRQASTHLSEKGVYWPDVNPNKENRSPNKISETFEITDSWIMFARPRSTTGFVHDIERFQKKLKDLQSNIPATCTRLVTELSDKKGLLVGGGLSSKKEPFLSGGAKKEKSELFFPKPFNDAQVQIIERLEANDGVVVQGPPGTGKTHTIANIICHYLATGRSVLVTSKGEPALSVLQDQIPKELRGLTISLLTNERQGLKQLEAAVQSLASIVSQTSLRELNQEAQSIELRVKQLKKEIKKTDSAMGKWGLRQLNSVDPKLSGEESEITAMELAQKVMSNIGKHEWLPDTLGASEAYNPKFSDSDIAKIRNARRALGKDISYVGKRLPNSQDMLDSANIVAIHDDLVSSAKIADDTEHNHIPPLAVSVENSIDRAKRLIKPLNALLGLLGEIDRTPWLGKIFYSWNEGASKGNDNLELFMDLKHELAQLTEQRHVFVKTLVEVKNPSNCFENVIDALKNLVDDKKPFGLFSFGNKDSKSIIEQIRVDGEKPVNSKQWKLALDYVLFQEGMRKFIIKWNHIGQELGLPELQCSYGSSYKDPQQIHIQISEAEKISKLLRVMKKELTQLFPHGVDVSKLSTCKPEIEKIIQAIKLNTSRISLGAQRLKMQDVTEKIKQCDGVISERISVFIEQVIGNKSYASDAIVQEWQGFLAELNRLNKLSTDIQKIENTAAIVEESGAPKWAKKLKTEPLLLSDDELTPVDWYESWQWKRRVQYLREIDGREELKKLSNKRSQLDLDEKRTFSELVRIKTNIGLHKNMSERVQSALIRFVSSVGKIGKGTGKRAPRFRKDAYKAMQDCYAGVPCWIMPTWRVSESLPSDFGSFNLVIIDEASQSDITALPAIMRAKKILIVGDDKQVSPTAAFLAEEKILQLKHNFLRDQPFAELLLPGISIYDLASAIFPSQRIMLTEHFRCVEPIIRFSMQFYNEPLIPLRIPKSSEKLTPPLIDVYVKNGVRDERRKINEIEAEAVVSEIKCLVSDQKFNGRSIGIISLIGAQQAQYIQEKLLLELGEDTYQNYKIACGDAATFQGKERDIMFLSMVVGANQGVVMNKREYEQRANVALSRARDRMYLYRSVEEFDLKNESDLRLKILRHFSNPMPQRKQTENQVDLCDSGFERDVLNKLLEKGYNVTPQVKVGSFSIDLVVEGENDRRVAIELDGDKYHPPEKWMDDWKRQRTMERIGWSFWRCWGSSYTIDPDGCIDDLVSVLNSMQIHPYDGSGIINIYTEQREYESEEE